jgi:beta-glucosidase
VKYAEGVFLGYRYYTSKGREPLFPFGFGLSYTTFSFANLEVRPAPDVTWPLEVSFDVTNTGARAGAAVPELYVGDPSALAPRPVKELKGFAKVRLEPGKTQRVALTLDRRAFAYFDAAAHQWRIDRGAFVLYVGDSSANTPLATVYNFTPANGSPSELFGP